MPLRFNVNELPLAMGPDNTVSAEVNLTGLKEAKLVFSYDRGKTVMQVRTEPKPVRLEVEIYKEDILLSRQEYAPGRSQAIQLYDSATSIAVCYDKAFWVSFELKE
jgi:hypothetical protein